LRVIGRVDEAGRAFLSVSLRTSAAGPPTTVEAWVDTAFDGDIVLSRGQITTLGRPLLSGGYARLADGSQIEMSVYSALVDWFGEQRFVEVVASDGPFPLLGVGLLLERALYIDYAARTLTLD
jgi:clan AA aspartic protease